MGAAIGDLYHMVKLHDMYYLTLVKMAAGHKALFTLYYQLKSRQAICLFIKSHLFYIL